MGRGKVGGKRGREVVKTEIVVGLCFLCFMLGYLYAWAGVFVGHCVLFGREDKE